VRKFDFFEVVTVVEHPTARELGVVGATGTILGVSRSDGSFSYSVSIDGEGYLLPESSLDSTGRFVERGDVYTGESIRVGVEGTLVGTADGDRQHAADADGPRSAAFEDYEVVTVAAHPDAAGLGLVGATGIVLGRRAAAAGPSYVVMIGDEPGSSAESYVLPGSALRSTGRRVRRVIR
jgi:hypothetical protein